MLGEHGIALQHLHHHQKPGAAAAAPSSHHTLPGSRCIKLIYYVEVDISCKFAQYAQYLATFEQAGRKRSPSRRNERCLQLQKTNNTVATNWMRSWHSSRAWCDRQRQYNGGRAGQACVVCITGSELQFLSCKNMTCRPKALHSRQGMPHPPPHLSCTSTNSEHAGISVHGVQAAAALPLNYNQGITTGVSNNRCMQSYCQEGMHMQQCPHFPQKQAGTATNPPNLQLLLHQLHPLQPARLAVSGCPSLHKNGAWQHTITRAASCCQQLQSSVAPNPLAPTAAQVAPQHAAFAAHAQRHDHQAPAAGCLFSASRPPRRPWAWWWPVRAQQRLPWA